MSNINYKTKEIKRLALEILDKYPDGLKYSELKRKILEHNNNFNHNTISGSTWNLDVNYPNLIYKPDRGVFRSIKFKQDTSALQSETDQNNNVSLNRDSIREEEFYKPFADWLVEELEECTKAIGLGGSVFKDKWGTPDVVGVRESKRSDIIQFPTEIVVGEIKTDSNSLITAFGQACAYKIFSHKSYIVVPKDSQIEDITRLDILCRQFGIGLILFDKKSPDNPQFEIRVRANRHEPDMFFVNKNLKIIEKELF